MDEDSVTSAGVCFRFFGVVGSMVDCLEAMLMDVKDAIYSSEDEWWTERFQNEPCEIVGEVKDYRCMYVISILTVI